jgi:formylglycine-generating enzyme required for sulfatase activity
MDGPVPVDAGHDSDGARPVDSSTMDADAMPQDSAPPPTDAGRCPDDAMVNAGTFCIDSREVTADDFQVFLLTPFDAGSPLCAWKDFADAEADLCGAAGSQSVNAADWCDAFAYCASKGKRLCGRIGGGPLDPAGRNNPLLDEWFYACGGPNLQTYPYGPTYQPSYCNGEEAGVGFVAQSGSFPNCQGYFPGLYDMSGNVWEWEDACDDAGGSGNHGADNCAARGGAYEQPGGALTCMDPNSQLIFQRNSNAGGLNCGIGIRCCSDLVSP